MPFKLFKLILMKIPRNSILWPGNLLFLIILLAQDHFKIVSFVLRHKADLLLIKELIKGSLALWVHITKKIAKNP